MAEETSDAVEISVQDTGIGIDPSERQRIFEKFYRSNDSSVREHSGHGLGLPLAQQIIQMHHGSIILDSEYGRGSTFTIRLEKDTCILIQEVVA